MKVSANGALDWHYRRVVFLNGYWLVVDGTTAAFIDTYRTVIDVIGDETRSVWKVDQDLILVG